MMLSPSLHEVDIKMKIMLFEGLYEITTQLDAYRHSRIPSQCLWDTVPNRGNTLHHLVTITLTESTTYYTIP